MKRPVLDLIFAGIILLAILERSAYKRELIQVAGVNNGHSKVGAQIDRIKVFLQNVGTSLLTSARSHMVYMGIMQLL